MGGGMPPGGGIGGMLGSKGGRAKGGRGGGPLIIPKGGGGGLRSGGGPRNTGVWAGAGADAGAGAAVGAGPRNRTACCAILAHQNIIIKPVFNGRSPSTIHKKNTVITILNRINKIICHRCGLQAVHEVTVTRG